MTKNINSKTLNNVASIGIALTLIALLGLPLVLKAFFKSSLGTTGTNMPMILSISVYICAIPYVIALIYLKKICKLIVNNNPFSLEIPKLLKKISICAFSEILIYNFIVIGLCYFYDIYLYALTIVPSVIFSFVTLAIGFLCLVLKKLFEIAIEIKDENDKTI